MPVRIRKKFPSENGKLFKIIEISTGKVVGESDTKKDAEISASYRNKAYKKKHKS